MSIFSYVIIEPMIEKIKKSFPNIILNEELKNHCMYRIGGKADFFYKAKTTEEIVKLIEFAKENKIKFILIGMGSNILFDDNGFRGLVIKNESNNIKIEGTKIVVDSGAIVAKIIKEALKKGLTGLEKWIGLPGTIGGAVRGNAGCNGLTMKDIFFSALVYDQKMQKIKEISNKYMKFGYRDSVLKRNEDIILKVTLKIKNYFNSKQESQIEEVRTFRLEKQPIGLSCGSFFKNPENSDPAGKLIEKAGLKGKKVGDAQISEKHGNFILNLGKASSEDIKKLAKMAKKEVKKRFGVDLHEEVQIFSKTGKIEL